MLISISWLIYSVQFSSVAQSCPTLCNPMNCSTPGLPVHHQLPFIHSFQSLSHVRLFATPWISAHQATPSITNSQSSLRLMSIESVMPSSHLILCHPILLLPLTPLSITLFQWVNSSHEVAKVLEFQLYHQSYQRTPKTDLLYNGLVVSLQSKGLSRVFSNTTVQKHQFFSVQLSSQSNSHIHTWPLEKP